MGRSAATSIWRCSDVARSGSRQMEQLLAASMERMVKSMKPQLFMVFEVSFIPLPAFNCVLDVCSYSIWAPLWTPTGNQVLRYKL
ncbi:hypothetical protein Tcan_05092 [Toxocara canis]|uniref:Uncharacterized protein n=1 Tax=Toxocara canis TaxID=6265 RepID=A0A0B2V7H4_TOXCA|nr:hypothetical protein Tcan_05092 [Toxocara canis]